MYTYSSAPSETLVDARPKSLVPYGISSVGGEMTLWNYVLDTQYIYSSIPNQVFLYRTALESKPAEVEKGFQTVKLYAWCKGADGYISEPKDQTITIIRTRSFSDDFNDKTTFNTKWKYNKLDIVSFNTGELTITITITNTDASIKEYAIKSLVYFVNDFNINISLDGSTGNGGLYMSSNNHSYPITEKLVYDSVGIFYLNGNTYYGSPNNPMFITVGVAPIYANIQYVANTHTWSIRYKFNPDDVWTVCTPFVLDIGGSLCTILSHYGNPETYTSYIDYVINSGVYNYY
jgi:hypothetical protein